MKTETLIKNLLVVVSLLMVSYQGTNSNNNFDKSLKENDAIAFFVLNCAYFAVWQNEIDPFKSKELNIGVVGSSNFVKSLEAIASRAMSNWFKDGKINIRKIERLDDKYYHIVFAENSSEFSSKQVINHYKNSSSFLIGKETNFAVEGGTIEVQVVDSKLQFEINLTKLQESGLDLNSGFKKRSAYFIKNGSRQANK